MAAISRIDLVPLPFAARMVYLLAYGVQLPAEHLSDRLNAMAYSLSTMATLYSLEGPTIRALSSEELAAGLFRKGAEEVPLHRFQAAGQADRRYAGRYPKDGGGLARH